MPTRSFMGAEIRRREDPRLITGSATYVDDLDPPGTVHMAVLRSPHAHARITRLDLSAARAYPGVLAVISGAEVAHLMPPREPEQQGGEQGGEEGGGERPPLVADVVHFVGEGVAAVVAENRYIAQDALELIDVEYEVLPAVVDVEAALRDDAPRVHTHMANNIGTRREHSSGDVDTAFAQAEVIISQRMVNQRLAPSPLETRGVLANYHPASGTLEVHSSTQCAHFVRDALADTLHIPQSRVRVIAPEVGGGFGCKIGAYPEDVLAAYLSMQLGRPVKWIETRSESFQATVHGRSQVATVELAATRDGRVLGLKLRLLADTGAYDAGWLPQITAGMITGCYDIQNLKTEAMTVFTNKTPLGAYRGAGRPEAAYFIERAMDLLARELDIDPAEVRRRNFIRPESFPYQTADWPVFDSGEYERALEAALERIGYSALLAEREQARAQGRLFGVGFASYIEVCGFGWETATVHVEPDGTVSLYTGISPHGQGQETTFSQLVADVLGIDPNSVTVLYGDTALGYGQGTMGSRGTAVGGTAVYRAAVTLREKMREIAANLLEVAPHDLELEEGAWRVRGVPERFVTVAAVARAAYSGKGLSEGMEPGLSASNTFNPENVTAPFGTHVAVVEVDPETGVVGILRYLTVDDCGTIVSPLLVRGQVHGGAAQGISQGLYEEILYSDDGQLLTSNFASYAIPTIGEIPLMEVTHTHTPTPRNDLGVKGVGEAGSIGATPAIVNAVLDALAPRGIRHLDMPLTPEKIWRALQSAGPS
jgi:carbon-monoxide dehydrogenase large subunit